MASCDKLVCLAVLRRYGGLLRRRRLFFVEPGYDLAYRRFAQQDDIAFG